MIYFCTGNGADVPPRAAGGHLSDWLDPDGHHGGDQRSAGERGGAHGSDGHTGLQRPAAHRHSGQTQAVRSGV